MPSEAGTQPQTAVRFSRVMRLRWVTALGASISVGLGVFTLNDESFDGLVGNKDR
jgi:hypothetical protein